MIDERLTRPHMDGRDVFKHAITKMPAALYEVLELAGCSLEDLAVVIPHQANLRISQAVAKGLGLAADRMYSNIQRYGNTTAASIPLALHECVSEGRIQRGDLVGFTAFGSGFTWGGRSRALVGKPRIRDTSPSRVRIGRMTHGPPPGGLLILAGGGTAMRRMSMWVGAVATVALALAACQPADRSAAELDTGFSVPVEYYTLDNGLRVVLSPDATAPIVTVAVYYNVGFRLEPRDRTGFAHLFEHMMFQGSENLGKMDFVKLVQENGGILNGSTRFDFTNYFEIVPSHKLETMLWAEADRMKGLVITQDNLTNQQGVVSNEVKVNVLNQPYGGFPWLDMPQLANENWFNAHNFYGELSDLEAATLEDVLDFFNTFYAPGNAALAVVGDFDPVEARQWIEQYFGSIPRGPSRPEFDIAEPRQEEEKRSTKVDALASRPALAFAYHTPERNSPEYWAFGLIDQILLQGEDSWLHQRLVQEEGFTSGVSGSMNGLGNMYNYAGPMLWTVSLFHDADVSADDILSIASEEIERIRTEPVDDETLARARIKLRSSLLNSMEGLFGFGRADLLASFALFDDDPSRINRIEAEFAAVTPELIQQTAQEYLRSTNRTILTVEPGAAADGAAAGAGSR